MSDFIPHGRSLRRQFEVRHGATWKSPLLCGRSNRGGLELEDSLRHQRSPLNRVSQLNCSELSEEHPKSNFP